MSQVAPWLLPTHRKPGVGKGEGDEEKVAVVDAVTLAAVTDGDVVDVADITTQGQKRFAPVAAPAHEPPPSES